MYKKNLVFIASCLGMLIFGVVLISLGSILPSITQKFALDEISVGTLASILPFGILLGSLIFGPIVDRYGYKNLLIICSFLVLIGLEGIALSTSLFVLQVSIFIIGFGGGVINGGTNALVADISAESKGANLSLLGVFFGIGALGMPSVLGLLSKSFSESSIISTVGIFVIIPILFFILIRFPEPKRPQGFPIKNGVALLKDSIILLMGFVLFFESGVEGIVNNWTTTYLIKDMNIDQSNALYALTIFVASMTVTRLILGGVLKNIPSFIVFYISLSFSLAGTIIMLSVKSYDLSLVGLILLGIGFAGVFPIILGYVGEIYSNISGTAFSIVFVIALIGNMLINYSVGLISHSFGIQNFTIVLLICLILMIVLFSFSIKKISSKIKI